MESKSPDPKDNQAAPEGESLEGSSPDAPVTPNPGASAPGEPAPLKRPSRLRGIFSLGNKYLAIFLVLVVVISVVTYRVLNSAKKSNPKSTTSTAQSLTSQQLAAISGSTTVVGDAQETLDIQSNSVFEGQVLLRSNLDVAGTIKVGGGLSLPSVTVGGVSSFGQAQINGTLSVAGDTNLQGQLTVEKSLTVAGTGTFGSLSTSQLNVSSLQLTGDLTISHHIALSGGTPSRTNGAALGAGGTASVNGSDTGGTVTVNTGGSPPAGCFVTINFTQKFSGTPHVVISPSNSASGSIDYYTNRSTTSFSVCTNSTPAAATTYIYDYIVFD